MSLPKNIGLNFLYKVIYQLIKWVNKQDFKMSSLNKGYNIWNLIILK